MEYNYQTLIEYYADTNLSYGNSFPSPGVYRNATIGQEQTITANFWFRDANTIFNDANSSRCLVNVALHWNTSVEPGNKLKITYYSTVLSVVRDDCRGSNTNTPGRTLTFINTEGYTTGSEYLEVSDYQVATPHTIYTGPINSPTKTIILNPGEESGYFGNNNSFIQSMIAGVVGAQSFDRYSYGIRVKNTLPSATPPTGLSADNVRPLTEGFTANVSVTGWGQGATNPWRELQCWTYDPNDLVTPRRYQPSYGNNTSGDITVSNSSNGTLNIKGNTLYTLGIYASNGGAYVGSNRLGDYTTLAYAPEYEITKLTVTRAEIKFTLKEDGGQYDKTLEYSVDGGETWTTVGAYTGGERRTGTISLTGNFLSSPQNFLCRVTTTAGTINGRNLLLVVYPRNQFYGSNNDNSTKITKFYGSISGQTRQIVKFYGSVGGQSREIF